CNITSARKLADLTKQKDPAKWEGFALGLMVVQQNNPKEAARLGIPEFFVDSLGVAFVVEPKKAAKNRTSKPKYRKPEAGEVSYPGKSAGGPPPHGEFTDADVPF